MKVYTYTEARRSFARVLDEARADGEVRITRRDGSEFTLRPVARTSSPLDVPAAASGFTLDEIVAAIREGRERDR